jgi:hypothetical protein
MPASYADTVTLSAVLSGALESPPTDSTGTGNALVTLDTTGNSMRVQVTFSGLTTGTTASHIHCCLPSPFLTGVNEPVATTLPTFPGFSLGVTSGTYDHTFDLTSASTYNLSNPALGGSAATAEPVLIAALLDGEPYLNIHTTMFPRGEIRGFVAVPGPIAGAGLPACSPRLLQRLPASTKAVHDARAHRTSAHLGLLKAGERRARSSRARQFYIMPRRRR